MEPTEGSPKAEQLLPHDGYQLRITPFFSRGEDWVEVVIWKTDRSGRWRSTDSGYSMPREEFERLMASCHLHPKTACFFRTA